MNQRKWLFIIGTFLPLFVAACNYPVQSQGPISWIDYPLDGARLPLTAFTMLAHASDVHGVDKVEFKVDDQLLNTVSVGGKRFEQASIEWLPPAAGIYTIAIRGVDSAGNLGDEKKVVITVGDVIVTPSPEVAMCGASELLAPLLLSPTDGSTVPEARLFWSYPDASCHAHSYKVDVAKGILFSDIAEDVSFTDVSLGFASIDHNETSRRWPLPPDKCYYWRVSAYVPDTYGPPSSVWQFCIAAPGETTTPAPVSPIITVLPEIVTPNIPEEEPVEEEPTDAVLVITPNIPAEEPVEEEPTDAVLVITPNIPAEEPFEEEPYIPVEEPVEEDTTPPSISNASIAPPIICAVNGPCALANPPLYPFSAVIFATITDESDVERVYARISGTGELEMVDSGNHVYQAALGPFTIDNAGEVTVIIIAVDAGGNQATAAPLTVQVQP